MTEPVTSRLRVLWAGWRRSYVSGETRSKELTKSPDSSSVFENILADKENIESNYVLHIGNHCAAVLNKYPYVSGHILILPKRAVPDLAKLTTEESTELWSIINDSVKAITVAYGPDGMNIGMNIGRAAGASIPEHLHVHCLPRWEGDTTFLTSVAEARMIPETLDSSFKRLKRAWPIH